MKNHLLTLGLIALSITATQCKSGLVTTSNGCTTLINTGQSQNKAGDYSSALDNFNKVLQKCDAYDAKEKGYAGKAAALNGLHQYNDALIAAMKGTSFESPRGPISIDPETRDIVQNVYIRRVERKDGELYNIEFDVFPAVKDPAKVKAQ